MSRNPGNPSGFGPFISEEMTRYITGVSRNSAGAALGLCFCELVNEQTRVAEQNTISDASGNYSFACDKTQEYFVRWQKPAPAAQRFYFHTETTLQSAPAAPTGCLTLSELVPDQTAGAAPSIAGGHTSSSGSIPASMLNKPTTKDLTEVIGLPPRVDTPAAAHQFGWFSDVRYSGEYAIGGWTFQWSEDDDSAGIVGRPILSVFAAGARDFTAMRLIEQISGGPDWWLGASDRVNRMTFQFPLIEMKNEYLFVQLWCHESASFSSGKTLTFDQEGSDRTDDARSWLQTPLFKSSVSVVAGASVDTLVAA